MTSGPAGRLHLAALQAQATAGTVSGTVFDAYTRAPLGEVTVSVDDRRGAITTTSAPDGRFTIPCSATIALTFRRLGYETYHLVVTSCADYLQVGLSAGTQNLNAVSVIATRDLPNLQQPQSVTTLAHAELTRGTGIFLDDALNLVPGVRMERRTMSGGQRITIRGYGNRSNFDGSGYKAYLNGIPITDAEGVTMLDDVDFATLGKVDVIRGPASSLYGAGIGGVVNLYTRRPDQPGVTLNQDLLSGADGLLRSDTRFASASSTSSLLLDYGKQRYDSYRIHSASRKDYATFVGDFRPSERRTISTYLGYANSFDERAGQLDSASFFNKRNTGESRYLQNDAHVKLESMRAGITHSYRVNDHFLPAVTAFFSGATREDIFAAGVTPKSWQTFGGRAVLNNYFGPANARFIVTTGLEFAKTNLLSKNYSLNNKVQGPASTDLENQSMQYSLFTQWEGVFAHDVSVTAGASVNYIEYKLVDRLTNTGNPTHKDLSGRQVYDPVTTPRLAIRKGFGDDLSIYASISGGFTPATSSDAVIAYTGTANTGLKPELATQYEIGAKGNLLSRRLAWQLALFDLKVRDKLTTQGVFDSKGTQLYSYTVNAGDQANKGLELNAGWSAVERGEGALRVLRPFFSLSLSDFTFTNFKSDNNNNARTVDYGGKNVPGVPRTVAGYGVDASFAGGVYLNATLQHLGQMPLTNDNVHEAPGYSLLNGKLGITRDLTAHLSIDAYAGGQNLTNELYYTMVFLNANYSGASPNIYLPGPYKARYFGGFRLKVRP